MIWALALTVVPLVLLAFLWLWRALLPVVRASFDYPRTCPVARVHRWSPLPLALVAFVAVVGLAAPTASAGAATGAGNGVAAINPASAIALGPGASVSPGRVGVPGPVFDDGAVMSLVTPRSSVLPKPSVSDPKLQNYVDNLYKGTTNPNRVGTGTTADAVRNEILTGQPTGGTFHTIKAQETVRGSSAGCATTRTPATQIDWLLGRYWTT